MSVPLYVTLLAVFCESAPEVPPISVRLTTPRHEYLLGEPVRLVVEVTNVSGADLQYETIYLRNCEPEISVFVSPDGTHFEPFRTCAFKDIHFSRDVKTLSPRRRLTYSWPVVYVHNWLNPPRGQLALPSPGHYWLKASYLLLTPTWHARYETNAIQITVRRPEGADEEMWESLNSWDVLYFLQVGAAPAECPDVVTRVAKVLDAHRTGGYADALRRALRPYYQERRKRMSRDEAMASEEMGAIRDALGIAEPPPGPFPEDDRLDCPVEFSLPWYVPYETLLAILAEQSGIPLSLDPKLSGRRSMGNSNPGLTLRRFMDGADGFGAKWVRDGLGYRLVHDPTTELKLKRTRPQ